MSVGGRALALGFADSSISTVDQFVRRGLKNLKTFSTVDGKLDSDLLDKHQLSCYELAFCTAELAAAREVCNYARKIGDDDSLAADTALGFTAEAITSALQRLLARATDLGLDVVELSALYDDSAINALRSQYGSAEFLARIG